MSINQWILIVVLTIGTYAIRLSGMFIGDAITRRPFLRETLNLLPGCLIVALVASSLENQPLHIWMGAVVALLVAIRTNNILLTMLTGFVFVVFFAVT